MMENCEEYQYKNSLNMFSLTLGPFERQSKNAKSAPIGKGGTGTAVPATKTADGQNDDEEQENSEEA